jgi:hypothetical protein
MLPTATYVTHETALAVQRHWPFEPDARREFNLRSLGMVGPYGIAVGLACMVITGGGAITADHQLAANPQAPGAHVRAIGAGTASYMVPGPVEPTRHNPARGAASPFYVAR